MDSDIVIVRGGGDIGTGVAHRLHREGFALLILEVENPMVVRRRVAFAQAVFDGSTVVEGVAAVRVEGVKEIREAWRRTTVPVVIDPEGGMVKAMEPDVFVDATLAKRNTGVHKGMAPITIGLGPGFKAGEDVDCVIETNRGQNLGRLIFAGYAEADTGIPAPVQGYTNERVLRAPCQGRARSVLLIGDMVKKGDTVCYVGDEPVRALLDGVIRGLIMDGMEVTAGFKIGDVDPRGLVHACYTISDKARAMGGAVLEAIFELKKEKSV